MPVNRGQLYRMPWSRADNPGGWIEATDVCDLRCPGCFRRRLEGHRPLAALEAEVRELRRRLNCDRIAVAGGEPLLYPRIVELVASIAREGMKPMILSNGTRLTARLARELRDAGLHTLYLHVDAGQQRPGWEHRSEREMNALRQTFADLLWGVGGIQCGFNVTVTRHTLFEAADVAAWALANVEKVKHLSLIAFRGLPLDGSVAYQLDGRDLPEESVPNGCRDPREISITTEEIFALLERRFPRLVPAAYLGGSARQETHKFLIVVALGGRGRLYGALGAKSIELGQVAHHLLKGRYAAAGPGRIATPALAALALFDRSARRALLRLLRAGFSNPSRWLAPAHLQTINLQQPLEVVRGEMNTCDGCVNLMLHEGKLINSCRLDEYRLLGGPLAPVARLAEAANDGAAAAAAPAGAAPGETHASRAGTGARLG
jgi:hypothetical protein